MRYLDKNSVASHALNLTVSKDKLMLLRPDLFGFRGFMSKLTFIITEDIDHMTYIKEQLIAGDSNPAVVVSVDPLRVAAYSPDLDSVAMLAFPNNFVDIYNLEIGTKLITVNTYKGRPPYHSDLILGPNNTGYWYGFHPIIADFVSDDMEKINKRKLSISDEEWKYVFWLGINYLKNKPNSFRDGSPVYSGIPSKK